MRSHFVCCVHEDFQSFLQSRLGLEVKFDAFGLVAYDLGQKALETEITGDIVRIVVHYRNRIGCVCAINEFSHVHVSLDHVNRC